MKILALIMFTSLFLIGSAIAAPPGSAMADSEVITVDGETPFVDAQVSTSTLTILPTDFIEGVAVKEVTVTNGGNVTVDVIADITIPTDYVVVTAILDSGTLTPGASTTLTITSTLIDDNMHYIFQYEITVTTTQI